MPAEDVVMEQERFLHNGGLYIKALSDKWKSGELTRQYVYHEYPKAIRLNERTEEVERSTEDVKGKTITWKEKNLTWDEVVVASEAEEERVLSGGKTTGEVEEERQGLIRRCRAQGVNVDPAWSVVRLRRELGDVLDAPEPKDDMAKLEQELAHLRKIAELREEIARLTAQNSAPVGESDDLRSQLIALGVKVDQRWGVPRLRDELDAATAPKAA